MVEVASGDAKHPVGQFLGFLERPCQIAARLRVVNNTFAVKIRGHIAGCTEGATYREKHIGSHHPTWRSNTQDSEIEQIIVQ